MSEAFIIPHSKKVGNLLVFLFIGFPVLYSFIIFFYRYEIMPFGTGGGFYPPEKFDPPKSYRSGSLQTRPNKSLKNNNIKPNKSMTRRGT